MNGQLPGQYAAEHVNTGAAPSMAAEGSYLVNISLGNQDSRTVILDGNTGTAPAVVYQRPIRQKLKVAKNIRTEPDGATPIIHTRWKKSKKPRTSALRPT